MYYPNTNPGYLLFRERKLVKIIHKFSDGTEEEYYIPEQGNWEYPYFKKYPWQPYEVWC